MIIFFSCIPNFTLISSLTNQVLDAIALHNIPSLLAVAKEEKARKRGVGRNLQTATRKSCGAKVQNMVKAVSERIQKNCPVILSCEDIVQFLDLR